MSGVMYVCGPMRGFPEHNFPAFNRAAERFRALGWTVLNPVEIGQEKFGNSLDVKPEDYMREDIRLIATVVTAIAVLPQWEVSTGARCEVAVGITLGLPFYDAGTGTRLETPSRCIVAGGYERSVGAVDTLDGLCDEVRAWANATFTVATPSSKAEHLRREANELCADPTDVEEMADIFILLAHASCGHDLVGAVRAKLTRNKARRWGLPDAHGVVEHVEVADVA